MYTRPGVGVQSQRLDCELIIMRLTRFCNCLLDYDYVLHIVNFAILYCVHGRPIKMLKAKEIHVCNLHFIQRNRTFSEKEIRYTGLHVVKASIETTV
jgi:hypothetical protein